MIETHKCQICKIELKNKRAKICSSNKCKSLWKMQRNKNVAPIIKLCKLCGKEFNTVDRRNNFCSSKCKADWSNEVKLKKYGTLNLESKESIKRRVAKATKTIKNKSKNEKERIIHKRLNTVKERYQVNNTFLLRDEQKRVNTLVKRYNIGSPRSVSLIKSCGFDNYEDFVKTIISLIEDNACSPYSDFFKLLLEEKFNCSSEIIDDVIMYSNRSDLLYKFKSTSENQIAKYIKSILPDETILRNHRPSFLKGKELDLWIPNKNLAIEFHGLAIHSERPIFYNKNLSEIKSLHEFKYLCCKNNAITLIQIFEDEWRDKPEIIKSIIKSKLGLTSNKLMARKCEIKEVNKIDRKIFFNSVHIGGDAQAKKSFGLYYKDKLVSVLSLRNTWNKSYGENVVEIARFASILDTNIAGGFQKLLKRAKKWALEKGYSTILTYADCRFGSGEVYRKAGFTHCGKTKINYFYERNGIRENRFKHRKRIGFTGDTEKEQQNNLGWYAIYDAGSEIYLLIL